MFSRCLIALVFTIQSCTAYTSLKLFKSGPLSSKLSNVHSLLSSDISTDGTFQVQQLIENLNFPSFLLSDEAIVGYSNLSLYFTLALYVLTLPGLYSLVTRSVKVKETQKTYDLPGPANPTAKQLKQIAGEVMAYFKALNYESEVTQELITFKGVMGRSKSQAAFLTFCTFMGLGSLGLVLSIILPDIGAKAYAITLLSPYAGIFYWNNAQREDSVSIKIEISDDEQTTSVYAKGGKEDLERFSQALQLPERGKIYVKGFFEGEPISSSMGQNSVSPVTAVTKESSSTSSSIE